MGLRMRWSVVLLAACLASGCDDDSSTSDGGDNAGGTTAGGGTGSTSGASNGTTSGGGTGSTGGGGNQTGGGTGSATGGNTSVPPCDASKAPDIKGLKVETVVSGLNRLVFAAQPPGSSDWYLVEQGGAVRVFTGGSLRSTPFLTVPNISVGGDDEFGLLGLAFAPDYAQTGKVYVQVTPSSGPLNYHDVIYEYTRSSADPYVANSNPGAPIVDVPESGYHHNGGMLAFGPDGYLYAGIGDGGGVCNSDQPNTPQDVSSLFGKILRLDPKKPAPHAADGNPFASNGDARVFHYGLRNPFRFNFDSATGDLYIGDVGQDAFEEVNFAPAGSAGLNFGWADYEATAEGTCPASFELRAGSTHTPPILGADRRGAGPAAYRNWISVIGGVVYRGSSIPALSGAYFFGDYKGRMMIALYHCGTQTSPITTIAKFCDPNEVGQACLATDSAEVGDLWAIVEGNDREIYLVANRSTLFKVVAP